MGRWAFDLDGTIDSCPVEFASIMQAGRAAGHEIWVVTGGAANKQTLAEKEQYLSSLGCGECYDQIAVLSDPENDKGDFLASLECDVMFDNTITNVKGALKAGVALCLVPWATRIKKAEDDGDSPELVVSTLIKAEPEDRVTVGVAYPANKPDANVAADGHIDFASPRAVEKAAWAWMKKRQSIGLWHEDGTEGHAVVVESGIHRGPDWVTEVNGRKQVVKAGDWILATQWDEDSWDLIKTGRITGYSPQGAARRRRPTAEVLANLRSE